jgi:hypothetical protein
MDPIIFAGAILVFVLAVGLVAALTRGPQAPGHLRVVGAVFLLVITAFCIFGFLATFEPPGVPAVRIIYTMLGVLSLLSAAWLATFRTGSVEQSS